MDQDQGAQWSGLGSIGEPEQLFVLQVDTGSSDLWVPLYNCTSPTCAKKNKYNPTKSTTSKAEPGHFSFEYADTSTVQGAIYKDTVSVAGIQVTDQFLGAAIVLSPLFATPQDGLVQCLLHCST
jgi:cathepsin D